MSIIEVRDLVIRYGGVTAVAGLDLTVESGQVLGLLGGNGAGKSSTLRAVAGAIPPTAGHLVVAGHDLTNPRHVEKARAAVGFCPDVGGLIGQATVREHVELALSLRGRRAALPAALDLVETFGLTDVLDRPASGFSHGMSRRLSVLLAAATAERVLVLDEPFDGVDPQGVTATLGVIAAARSRGLGVLVSTHLRDLLVAASDQVAVVVGGRCVDCGPVGEFTGSEGQSRYDQHLAGHARAFS